jgi:hypothetical protein
LTLIRDSDNRKWKKNTKIRDTQQAELIICRAWGREESREHFRPVAARN